MPIAISENAVINPKDLVFVVKVVFVEICWGQKMLV